MVHQPGGGLLDADGSSRSARGAPCSCSQGVKTWKLMPCSSGGGRSRPSPVTSSCDRKTVRAYLNGERQPGVRRSSAPDPLAPFVGYVKARFVDDPHLWASALFDEVVPLGYGCSYPSFARQLRVRWAAPAL